MNVPMLTGMDDLDELFTVHVMDDDEDESKCDARSNDVAIDTFTKKAGRYRQSIDKPV